MADFDTLYQDKKIKKLNLLIKILSGVDKKKLPSMITLIMFKKIKNKLKKQNPNIDEVSLDQLTSLKFIIEHGMSPLYFKKFIKEQMFK